VRPLGEEVSEPAPVPEEKDYTPPREEKDYTPPPQVRRCKLYEPMTSRSKAPRSKRFQTEISHHAFMFCSPVSAFRVAAFTQFQLEPLPNFSFSPVCCTYVAERITICVHQFSLSEPAPLLSMPGPSGKPELLRLLSVIRFLKPNEGAQLNVPETLEVICVGNACATLG